MQRVRELFVSIMEGDEPPTKRPGRPKGSTNKPTETSVPAKRTMSAEGKARITRKYAVKPKAAKKTPAKAKKVAPAAPEVATTDATNA